MKIVIRKAGRRDKKYEAVVGGKTIPFGAAGYEDFTTHGDEERKARYIARHRKTEDWTRGGVDTAGFYARWVLWNKTTVAASVRDLNARFSGISFAFEPS